ncbi:tail fiber assembly protein [Kluyvera cryocrescens]|uniref:tail fiber assembly protein n=1 Tax=Kluyvera cryocrescens TaxID=580 RepID=UPI000DD35B3E|nr:tail fiber assembly protein [Kluyvera cryocrescens]
MKPVFENGLATSPGDLRCFYYDADTGEYKGWSDENINIGVSMPGHSTDIDPGAEQAGIVAVFNGTAWQLQADHRGKTVYSTADGRASIVGYIGEIKTGFTELPPSTPYDVWNGAGWATDTDTQHTADVATAAQKKSALRGAADNEIDWLQDAVDAGIATDEETALLTNWKAYRVQLMRIKTDTAPDIEWPTPPVLA